MESALGYGHGVWPEKVSILLQHPCTSPMTGGAKWTIMGRCPRERHVKGSRARRGIQQ